MTVMSLVQAQVAGMSTAHEPPELKVVALIGPLPQSTTTTISYVTGDQGEVTGLQSPDSVPETWTVLVVEPPIGIPMTDVMVMEHMGASRKPVYHNSSGQVIIQNQPETTNCRLGHRLTSLIKKPNIAESWNGFRAVRCSKFRRQRQENRALTCRAETAHLSLATTSARHNPCRQPGFAAAACCGRRAEIHSRRDSPFDSVYDFFAQIPERFLFDRC
jgi:hypothetical protein